MQRSADPSGTWEIVSAAPAPALRSAVLSYRGFRLALAQPRQRLEVPVGAVTLLINFGQALRITSAQDGSLLSDSARPLFSGLRTKATIGSHSGHLGGIEVVMTPWAAHALFGHSMEDVTQRLTPARDLLGPAVQTLADDLAGSSTWAARFALLDSFLRRRITPEPAAADQVVQAWGSLRRSAGTVPLSLLAEETGWSARHLERRFRTQIGLAPKAVARIFRLQRALQLLASGCPPERAAHICGFCDNAHFCHEVKAMTGSTPLGFLSTRTTASPGPYHVDRISAQVTSAVL